MTVIPLVSVDRLETEFAFSEHGRDVHEARCHLWAGECDACAEHDETVRRCRERLDAARSQQPERHIDPGAAKRRRLERIAGEAA